MDYGKLVAGAFAYTKDAIIGKWKQWALIILATILLFIPLLGYSLRVLRGENPAPEVIGWGALFVDGIRYLIVVLVYAIPLLVILLILPPGLVHAILTHDSPVIPELAGGAFIGFLFLIAAGVITLLIIQIGLVRFARTGTMGEAFNFSAIVRTIGRIGWLPYILATIILFAIEFVIEVILTIFGIIPHLPFILGLVIIGPLVIFDARFTSELYDSAGPE